MSYVYYPYGAPFYYDPNPFKINNQGVSSLGTAAMPDFDGPSYITTTTLPLTKMIRPIDDEDDTKKMMIDYFKKKTNEWLDYDYNFNDVLKYFKIKNQQVVFITEKKDIKLENSDDERYMKKKYIKKVFITDDFIKRVLDRYIRKTHTKWSDLKKNSIFVKDVIHNKLKNFIKQIIKENIEERRGK